MADEHPVAHSEFCRTDAPLDGIVVYSDTAVRELRIARELRSLVGGISGSFSKRTPRQRALLCVGEHALQVLQERPRLRVPKATALTVGQLALIRILLDRIQLSNLEQ